jgi:F-type H+-transporting ATPase subunit a
LGPVDINATVLYTWIVMALLALGSHLVTRNLSTDFKMSRWQNLLEVVVSTMNDQIQDVSQQSPRQYLPFVGTLFVYIVTCNILAVVPGFTPPTASLSTTAGLALCVLAAVPLYGIRKRGLGGYFKLYIKPSPVMLPFNIMGELSRTLALAVRLFGNMMSGTKIVAVLLAVIPLIFPVVMNVLGLLTGIIQAYIFAILAMVYIASGTRVQQKREAKREAEEPGQSDNQT